MISLKVNPDKFDYIMYVDASGDDGLKFDHDSSLCYAAAAFLVAKEDISLNLNILSQIKQIVGCKEIDEVKYSRIRRHRRASEALALLKELRGKVSCHVIFKKELLPEDPLLKEPKNLSVLCHLMAMNSLDSYSFSEGQKILVAIDRMKRTEERPLERQMNHGVLSNDMHPDRNFTVDTVFRDSKDSQFLLIQIADLLCGIVREQFEQYETNEDMIYFKERCPRCNFLSRSKKGHTCRICTQGRSRATQILYSKNFGNIYHLIPEYLSPRMATYLFMGPPKMAFQHYYLFCKKK